MVLSNADNTTRHNKSQETNYEIAQRLTRAACKANTTHLALRILIYQIDQEFGFIKNGNIKDGDLVGHAIRSKFLEVTRRGDIKAMNELEALNILKIDRQPNRANRYHINRDTSTWKRRDQLNSTHTTSDKTDAIEYTFTPYQTKELLKHCDDIEAEKLWLQSMGIP